MNPFQEEIKLRKEIDSLNNEQLEEKYKTLSEDKQILILIRWFGMCPLFEKMINKESGLKYLKEELNKELIK